MQLFLRRNGRRCYGYISISFDYLVLGELGRHQAGNGRSFGTGIFYVKYSDTVVAEEGLLDALKEVDSGNLFVANGEWNTVTYVASDALELDSFMINFYKLEGEALITNIVVEYAPLETYNKDGSLNTTVVLKENVESETLTTIVDKKIKQCVGPFMTKKALEAAGEIKPEGKTSARDVAAKR